jgi:hypothetical protein
MPAANKLTIAALLAVALCVAGCNSSKKASSTDAAGAAATTAAVAASGADSGTAAGSAAAAATAPAGGGASASGGCALTAAQVTSAMGATYGAPQNFNGICNYLGSNNSLTIQVLNASGINDFAGTLATAKQDQGTDTTTAIPGLGDKATGVGLEIVVQSGSKIIDVRNADSPGFGNWPKSIALAKLVIAGQH